MSNTLESAAELAKTLFSNVSNLVETYGPKAVDITFQVVRIEAIGDLLLAVFFLLSSIAILVLLPYMGRQVTKADNSHREEKMFAWISGIVCSVFYAGFAFIAALCILLNVWTYVAITNPELYLAKKVITKILSTAK